MSFRQTDVTQVETKAIARVHERKPSAYAFVYSVPLPYGDALDTHSEGAGSSSGANTRDTQLANAIAESKMSTIVVGSVYQPG